MLLKNYTDRHIFLCKSGVIIAVLVLFGKCIWYLSGTSETPLAMRSWFQKNNSFNVFKMDSRYFENIAVIVEFRSTALLVTIVLNVIQNIPEHWPIQIFHCSSNAQFIKSSRLSTFLKTGKIILTELDNHEGSFLQFTNTLMTNVSFWTKVRGEKVLFFQIDSVMCSNSPHKITDYLQYDFIGAPWCEFELCVGNGGFSLRSRNKTLTLLQRKRYLGEINEDMWYATHMSTVGIIASLNVSKTFSVETTFYSNPLGVHKLLIGKADLKKLCEACPEARLVPPYCM